MDKKNLHLAPNKTISTDDIILKTDEEGRNLLDLVLGVPAVKIEDVYKEPIKFERDCLSCHYLDTRGIMSS